MVKEFIIGTKYYLKVDIAQMELDIVNNPNEMISLTFDGGAKARFNNGSWISQGSYNYILLRVTGNPNQQAIFVGGSWHNLSDYNTFEIIGTLRSTQQALTTSNNYKLMLRSAIDNPVEFHLYNVSGKFNNAQKILNREIEYYGVFKEETDVLNPVILIESDSFITSNYAYITPYRRYYFITDITCVRKNLYRLSLKVDVLKTWYRDIRDAGEGLIVRSANFYLIDDGDLVDDRLPLKDKPEISFTNLSSSSGSLKNVDVSSSLSYNIPRFAVTLMNDSLASEFIGNETTKQKPTGSSLPDVSTYSINNPTLLTYFLTFTQYLSLAQAVKNRSNLADYIVNITIYPFNVGVIDGGKHDGILVTKTLRVNNVDITDADNQPIQAYCTANNISSYLVVSDNTLIEREGRIGLKFLNYEPYSTYQIYIPFHGWEDVKSYDVVNNRIIVYYVTDYSSGLSRWFIYNFTNSYIIKSGSCDLGFRLGISTTNMYELNRQKQANATSTALGVIGSLIGMGVSIGTGNVIGGVGSGLSLAQSIASGINRNNMLIEHGNISTGGDGIGYYTTNQVYLKQTYRDMLVDFDFTEYETCNGLPVNQFNLFGELGDNEMEGYIEIIDFHMNVGGLDITKTEMDEIESLLKTGVYL